jgi:protein-tyrosine phosphatase
VIDIHSHILPGLDDGSKSWDMTIEMCRIAIADGITHIVATPHANDEFIYQRENVREKVAELDSRLSGELAFSIGCDFHLSYDNVEDALVNPQRYTIAGKQYLLVELSDYAIPPQIKDIFFRLLTAGLVPIITHPERNRILQRTPAPVLDWVQAGCLVQVTASAVTGFWGEQAQAIALWLIKHGAVHVLATDAHDAVHRPPVLSAARDLIARQFGAELAQALVLDNPSAIVNGKPLVTRSGALERKAQ